MEFKLKHISQLNYNKKKFIVLFVKEIVGIIRLLRPDCQSQSKQPYFYVGVTAHFENGIAVAHPSDVTIKIESPSAVGICVKILSRKCLHTLRYRNQ